MDTFTDRRKRKRVGLRWPVRLFRRQEMRSVESTTENITSNGFYCVSREPFRLGERLECIIVVPSGSYGYSEAPICLQCRVRVTRVEDQQEGFGLGCWIEDYDLLVNSKAAHRMAGAQPPLI